MIDDRALSTSNMTSIKYAKRETRLSFVTMLIVRGHPSTLTITLIWPLNQMLSLLETISM